jgi:hypothetical protein
MQKDIRRKKIITEEERTDLLAEYILDRILEKIYIDKHQQQKAHIQTNND